ncbi:MAG: hypothetical protein CBB87_02220 [Micavibrio sp. TMED27]|nr:hypothetical protein [Micavibrio sp.]OUT92578.1 MAG: hypothetical protein CBB87_02220 [Micavibrio sp. TMED27]|tara:strand:- start:3573 stop:3902 length:330 start_codon:yes stop_codon:yes gene_type:complete
MRLLLNVSALVLISSPVYALADDGFGAPFADQMHKGFEDPSPEALAQYMSDEDAAAFLQGIMPAAGEEEEAQDHEDESNHDSAVEEEHEEAEELEEDEEAEGLYHQNEE